MTPATDESSSAPLSQVPMSHAVHLPSFALSQQYLLSHNLECWWCLTRMNSYGMSRISMAPGALGLCLQVKAFNLSVLCPVGVICLC